MRKILLVVLEMVLMVGGFAFAQDTAESDTIVWEFKVIAHTDDGYVLGMFVYENDETIEEVMEYFDSSEMYPTVETTTGDYYMVVVAPIGEGISLYWNVPGTSVSIGIIGKEESHLLITPKYESE